MNPSDEGETIVFFDEFGREITISRARWCKEVLPVDISRFWTNPDVLSEVIVHAIRNGASSEVAAASEHLVVIDHETERSHVLRAHVLIDLGHLDEADQVSGDYLEAHPDSGRMLAVAARIASVRGDTWGTEAMLWQALKANPNDAYALDWYLEMQRAKGGEPAFDKHLARVEELPGSWFAKIERARLALGRRDGETAMELYRQIFEQVEVVPGDALVRMTYDLRVHSRFQEIVDLLFQRFDAGIHGLGPGHNLLFALGRLEDRSKMRTVIEKLYAQQRPDWLGCIEYWKRETDRMGAAVTAGPLEAAALRMVRVTGPVWMNCGNDFGQLLESKAPMTPLVAFVAASCPIPRQHESLDLIVSRGLALYLSEKVHLSCSAEGVALIPCDRQTGGPCVHRTRWEFADLAKHLDAGELRTGLLWNIHIDASAVRWKCFLRAHDIDSGKVMEELTTEVSPLSPMLGFNAIAQKVVNLSMSNTRSDRALPPSWWRPPPGPAFGAYLKILSGAVDILSATTAEVPPPSDTVGARQTFEALIELSLEDKDNVALRLMLLAAMAMHRETGSTTVSEYQARVEALQRMYPVGGPAAERIAMAAKYLFL